MLTCCVFSIPSPRLGDRKHTTCWLKIISNHNPWEILYIGMFEICLGVEKKIYKAKHQYLFYTFYPKIKSTWCGGHFTFYILKSPHIIGVAAELQLTSLQKLGWGPPFLLFKTEDLQFCSQVKIGLVVLEKMLTHERRWTLNHDGCQPKQQVI